MRVLFTSILFMVFMLMSGNAFATECIGNACESISGQYDQITKTYHFQNDSYDKTIILKVTEGTVLGCSGSKTKKLKPGERWNSGFSGLCDYVANGSDGKTARISSLGYNSGNKHEFCLSRGYKGGYIPNRVKNGCCFMGENIYLVRYYQCIGGNPKYQVPNGQCCDHLTKEAASLCGVCGQ